MSESNCQGNLFMYAELFNRDVIHSPRDSPLFLTLLL